MMTGYGNKDFIIQMTYHVYSGFLLGSSRNVNNRKAEVLLRLLGDHPLVNCLYATSEKWLLSWWDPRIWNIFLNKQFTYRDQDQCMLWYVRLLKSYGLHLERWELRVFYLKHPWGAACFHWEPDVGLAVPLPAKGVCLHHKDVISLQCSTVRKIKLTTFTCDLLFPWGKMGHATFVCLFILCIQNMKTSPPMLKFHKSRSF